MIAAIQRCSVQKVFLEISQNSQENTCTRASFFNNVAGGAFFTEHLWATASVYKSAGRC